MKRKSKRENSRSSSCEISSRWIYIALQNVGDIEPQKLSKARPECQGIRSMRWAIEKIPKQTEVMCGRSRVIVVSIKILLFSVEQKRGILRGYCGDNRPRSICQAVGLVREHLLVKGQVNVDVKMQANEWRKVTGHESSGRWSEDKFLICFDGAKVRKVDLPSIATFWAIPLLRISIRKE